LLVNARDPEGSLTQPLSLSPASATSTWTQLATSLVPRAGMLAKLGELHLHTDCIPDDGEALEVRAERLSVLAAGCLYAFEVTSGRRAIASGRLMVAFTAQLTP